MFSEITLSFYPFARFTVNCVLTHAVGHAEDGSGAGAAEHQGAGPGSWAQAAGEGRGLSSVWGAVPVRVGETPTGPRGSCECWL